MLSDKAFKNTLDEDICSHGLTECTVTLIDMNMLILLYLIPNSNDSIGF